ncbi:MAG: hypothetical protein ACRC2M_03715, partial [Planktothrix sp.]
PKAYQIQFQFDGQENCKTVDNQTPEPANPAGASSPPPAQPVPPASETPAPTNPVEQKPPESTESTAPSSETPESAAPPEAPMSETPDP